MLTLYHAPQTRSSRVLWLLEEAGAPYRIEYVDISRQDGSGGTDTKNPHPEGKVPIIEHEGDLVWETAAIFTYVADLCPDSGLIPAPGEKGRGPVLSWLAYYAGVIEPTVHFEFAGLADNPVLTRTYRGRAERDARILNALKEHDYLTGDRFTAADLLLASFGQFMRDMLPAGEAVDSYIQRCTNRPALARAMAKDTPS